MRYLSTILILVSSTMFASLSYAESYVCSADLTRFDRPGEIETSVYTRNGKIFKNDFEWIFEIVNESDSILTLIHVLERSGMLVQIDKNSKEYGELYYSMEVFRKHPSEPQTFGKCVVVN